MHSREHLAAAFRSLGVTPGDIVMLHASVRAVGETAGGPDTIHLALKDALTDAGMLLMYAGCPQYFDEVGRGNLTAAEEAEVLEKLPPFDAQTARCARDHGVLAEFFRTYPGTIVNDHVTRFAASGRHAADIFKEQPWDFAFGRGSCLDHLVQLDGKILLLGSDHDAVTFLHYAEHIVDIPDKIVARFKVPVLENGDRVWRDMAEYDTAERAHASWPEQFFAKIVDGFLESGNNHGGRVGNAQSYLMSARDLLAFALRVMVNTSAHDRR
jgi:aminoglycoside 3-N-acetyltransferase